jgi:hypothetical protein
LGRRASWAGEGHACSGAAQGDHAGYGQREFGLEMHDDFSLVRFAVRSHHGESTLKVR